MLETQSGGNVMEKPSESVMVRLPLKERASWSELSELLAGLAERAEAKAEVTECGSESGYCDVLIWASKPEPLTRGSVAKAASVIEVQADLRDVHLEGRLGW